ncbi:MAG: NFACT RNA binding domain-containing protein [Desulfobacterales bacterium]|nr:NFACT RNA binding domain-containing protein [Desulfobacterales bacterium]MDD4072556.1 NFACT RNA binding domain-containing protein [Desulfobacterales bacterium]MDD4393825.1 NFACT RNA binding domain-containing protein [Desulfobacterales bacterium]
MAVQKIDKNWYQVKVYEYRFPDDWIVLAGRSDEDNDRLSIKLAKPDDWWFHVRGMPGSHVILRSETGQKPDRKILEMAAAVAAWHSKARAGGMVAVSCTQARFVTKPRGVKAGTVAIRNERVLKVRPGLPPSDNE